MMPGDSTAPTSARILYVDDDPIAAVSIKRLLEHLGHRVTGSRNPQEAIKFFAATPDHWDVVLTDLKMPGLDGVEVAERVLALRPQQPLVLITGFAEPREVARARVIGFRAIIQKPATLNELAHAIHLAFPPPNPPTP